VWSRDETSGGRVRLTESTSKQLKYRSFTVVIPTRERAATLRSTILSALNQDYPSFKILVCDNASSAATREVAESFNDSRITYKRSDTRLSMSHNWEFALKDIDSDWLTVIGDDDALMPNGLQEANRIAEVTGVKAIRSQCVYYQWPNYRKKETGFIKIRPHTRDINIIDTRDQLSKVLNGPTSYETLPVLYTGGFIESSLLDKIRNQSGGIIFHSQNPDVYTGIMISLLISEYCYTSLPLAIQGASIHSNGSARFSKNHRRYDGQMAPDKKFISEDNIPFHAHLPLADDGGQIQSIPVIIYEAYLQAMKYFPGERTITSDQAQLHKALGMPGIFSAEINAWAIEFSRQNQLLMPTHLQKAKMFIRRLKRFIGNRASLLFRTITINGTSDDALSNSYAAAITANKIVNP